MTAAPSSSPESTPDEAGRRGIIVVGLDGSANSLAALRAAAAEAARTGSLVRVVNACIAKTNAVERLEGYVSEVFGDRPPVDVSLQAIVGDPADVLLAAAGEADLLVIGAHGQSDRASSPLGSIAQYCVAHAWCPVLVVPAPVPVAAAVGAD